MQPREGYVTTEDGLRLYYQAFDDGPETILFPNGLYLVDEFKYLARGRTLVFYDVRNRGRSDPLVDESQSWRGVHHDIDDMDTVRRHFGSDAVDLIGHSYMGLVVILYAMKYGAYVRRVVQLGPMEPRVGHQYPAHLTGVDRVLQEFFAKMTELQKERASTDPEAFCRKFWSILRPIYVVNPADADKIKWDRCDLPNERNFMKYWMERLLPSMQQLDFGEDKLANVRAPVLTIHGTKDRSAPYGGARDWALRLPNARLVTIENAAHGPWIENPQKVFSSVETFLAGGWPPLAEKVEVLDPGDGTAQSHKDA